MRRQPPHVVVHDVTWSGRPEAELDRDQTGPPSRLSPIWLAAAVAAAVAVAVIVLSARQDRPVAHALTPASLAGPTELHYACCPPRPRQVALVEDATTCFQLAPGRGGSVALLIRNQFTHSVTIRSVTFLAQPGVGVRDTAILTGRALGLNCLTPSDRHPAVGFVAHPGPLWLSSTLTSTPVCGKRVTASWLVTYVDRDGPHRLRLDGADLVPRCASHPTRPHPIRTSTAH